MKLIDPRLAMAAIAFGVVILLLPLEAVILFLSDDAYYYLQVAQNNIEGRGLTFDGINPTNGWHPLWMLLVHPIFALGLGKSLALKLTLLLQLLIFTLALGFLSKSIQRFFASNTVLAGAATVLFFAPVTVLALNGLESPLLLLTETLLIYLLFRLIQEPENATLRLQIGVMLALVFLSRLDTAFVILGVASWLLLTEWLRLKSLVEIISRWWLPAVISVVLVVPYFLWNMMEHGHLTPISGVLKNTFPYPHFRIGFLPRVPHFVAAILATLIWFSYRTFTADGSTRPKYLLLLALTLGCIVHLFWSVVFMAWGTFQWHFIAQIPVIAFAVVDFIDRFPQLRRLSTAAAVFLALAITLGTVALRNGHHSERLMAASWVNQNIEPERRIGLRDAGVFGYFAQQGVVNLDGLINSYEFVDAINNGTVQDFLDQSNVDYLADAYVPCDYDKHPINIVAHASSDPRQVVGEVRLMSKHQELASFATVKPFENVRLGQMCFVIWRGTGTALPLPVRPPSR